MSKFLLALAVLGSFQFAHADASLARNGKVVKCTDLGFSLTLSAARKTIDLTIRDHNYGVLQILNKPDFDPNAGYVSFVTSAGELMLDDEADTFIDKWQAYFPDCQ